MRSEPEIRGPDSSHGYIAGIDGLRAVAVVAVMLYHLAPGAMPGGFVGVDVFFVISGYVVTASLLRDSGRPLGSFIAAFYARRFRRIVPPLVICLCVSVWASVTFIPESWLSQSLQDTALSAFLGLSNIVLITSNDGYFAPRTEFNPYTHTWSLAVEEQFYVLFPFILYLWTIRRRAGSGRVMPVAFAALCLISLIGCAWASRHHPNQAYFLLPSRFWELGTGAGLCLLKPAQRRRTVETFGPRVLSAAGVMLLVLALATADPLAFPFPWALPAVAGSALLILSMNVAPGVGVFARLLATPTFVRIGKLSYSLYLWHWPVYTLARWTTGLDSLTARSCAVGLTTLLAWLSYRWVERPSQHHPVLRRWPSWAAIISGLVLLTTGWTLALQTYTHSTLLGLSVVTQNRDEWYGFASRMQPMPGVILPCKVRGFRAQADGLEYRSFEAVQCNGVAPDKLPRLFVVGDSHASAYDRLLNTVTANTGVTVVRFSKGGCPLAGLIAPVASYGRDCEVYGQQAVGYVLRQAQPGDIVWLASLRVPRLGDQGAVFKPLEVEAQLTSDAAVKSRAAAVEEAKDLINRLTVRGLRVVFDAPKPVFGSPPYRCSDYFNRGNPVCSGGLSVTRDLMDAHRSPTLQSLAALSTANLPIDVWDPLPHLCSSTECTAVREGHPLFFDGDHLSGYGNEVLSPSFLSFFSGVLSGRQVTVATRAGRDPAQR